MSAIGRIGMQLLDLCHDNCYDIDLKSHFNADLKCLQVLVADVRMEFGTDAIQGTARGRFLLRITAMWLDACLAHDEDAPARFSRAV